MQTATNYPINEYPNERDRQFTREQEGVHERVWREEKGRGNEVIIISTIKKNRIQMGSISNDAHKDPV